MSLVDAKHLLQDALQSRYALPAFSILNTDALLGVIAAAEKLSAPVIIQMAERRFEVAPLESLGRAMVAAAEQACVPVIVHLDHGLSKETIQSAIGLGFTSVMIDASMEALPVNIERTVEVIAVASDIAVESEIGSVGTEGESHNDDNYRLSSVADAVQMYERAKPDTLAVAIGNKHGHYQGEPQLNFERLQAIHEAIPIPLVLHGGSGISSDDVKRCINLGVAKINIATDLYTAAVKKLQQSSFTPSEAGFIEMQRCVQYSIYQQAMEHIHIFGCAHKV